MFSGTKWNLVFNALSSGGFCELNSAAACSLKEASLTWDVDRMPYSLVWSGNTGKHGNWVLHLQGRNKRPSVSASAA